MYASAAARDADIDAGAPTARPPPSWTTCATRRGRFAEAVDAMPAQAWAATVQPRRGPGRRPCWSGVGCARSRCTTSTWPPATDRPTGRRRSPTGCCTRSPAGLTPTGPTAPSMVLRFDGSRHDVVIGDRAARRPVTGPAPELAAWLTGRGAGATLTVAPDGPLPTPPEWM